MAARRHGAAMAVAALVAALTMAAPACSSSQPEPPAPAKKTDAAVSTVPVTPTPTPRPRPPNLFSLSPAIGRGHLGPGSDPRALPGDVLIADENNNRLLLVDPQGRIRWRVPAPRGSAARAELPPPDDAFVSPDGRAIIVTQERTTPSRWSTSPQAGSSGATVIPACQGLRVGYFSHPDDAMMFPVATSWSRTSSIAGSSCSRRADGS